MTPIESKPLPEAHLINILKDTRAHHPNFCLLLGAGASRTSGIKTANEMICNWRTKFHQMHGSSAPIDDYLSKQKWYNQPTEYSYLFEALFDQPSQRREYIETCCADAHPSWGYIYLVNLLAHNVFNTVFTTNFDDLLNEACYLYSEKVRPIVCAHDSSIKYIRITSKRQKIIKLHGDFLFDNIKNTIRELESLEDNMKEKFKQHAGEYGLIVVGYSGSDRSIMETLTTLMRADGNFPHGIYWCIREGQQVSGLLEDLCRNPKFHLVEIKGFDEFFAETHEELGLRLQTPIADPYSALASRLNKLIDSARIPEANRSHRVIDRDLKMLGSMIQKQILPKASSTNEPNLETTHSDQVKLQINDSSGNAKLPFLFLAQMSKRNGNIEDSYNFTITHLEQKPSLDGFNFAFELIGSKWIEDKGKKIISLLKENRSTLSNSPSSTHTYSLQLMTVKQFDLAQEILDLGYEIASETSDPLYNNYYYLINSAQIYLHQGKEIPEKLLSQIKEISSTETGFTKFGADVVLKNYKEATDFLMSIPINNGIHSLKDVIYWPIAQLLPFEDRKKIIDRITA
jgi:SIR2-like domain